MKDIMSNIYTEHNKSLFRIVAEERMPSGTHHRLEEGQWVPIGGIAHLIFDGKTYIAASGFGLLPKMETVYLISEVANSEAVCEGCGSIYSLVLKGQTYCNDCIDRSFDDMKESEEVLATIPIPTPTTPGL
jgi:hypothetical protein